MPSHNRRKHMLYASTICHLIVYQMRPTLPFFQGLQVIKESGSLYFEGKGVNFFIDNQLLITLGQLSQGILSDSCVEPLICCNVNGFLAF